MKWLEKHYPVINIEYSNFCTSLLQEAILNGSTPFDNMSASDFAGCWLGTHHPEVSTEFGSWHDRLRRDNKDNFRRMLKSIGIQYKY